MDFKWHDSLPWIQFQRRVKRKFILRSELFQVSIKSSRHQLPSPHLLTAWKMSEQHSQTSYLFGQMTSAPSNRRQVFRL